MDSNFLFTKAFLCFHEPFSKDLNLNQTALRLTSRPRAGTFGFCLLPSLLPYLSPFQSQLLLFGND